MNSTALTVLLVIYLAVLIVIGVIDIRKAKSFNDFAVAGKKQTSFVVIMSLLATVIGASTTMGITTTVYNIGFPGIWWLIFGAVGLLLQSLLISEKVRSLNADTLPHAVRIMAGRPAELIVSIVIVVSWIGIIAGQLVAMSGVISFITGKSSKTVFVVVAICVILYTTIGGQLSVVKTDAVQFVMIVLGITACCIYLYFFADGNTASVAENIEFINKDYRPINLLTQFFVIGGVYFLGPDIMSRNLISKDEKTAKKSALTGGLALLVYAVIIVLIGMWAKYNISPETLGDMNALMYVIKHSIPAPIGIMLSMGLVSAILSSTDTCLVNASTIFVKDIIKKDSILLVRAAILVFGGLSMVMALAGSGDIITLLSNAYSVYTPGVIFPLLVAIFAYKKRRLVVPVWVAAVVVGGAFGVAGAYFPEFVAKLNLPNFVESNMSLVGMGFSLIIAVLSIRVPGRKPSEPASPKRSGQASR